MHHMGPNNMPPQKASMTMDSQYMQQQSQIFVFSTQLANRAAECVDMGQFPSIIDFHCANPETKKFLEKHPLKVQQLNRQNPAVWLNNLAQMKQGVNQNICSNSPQQWQSQQQQQLFAQNFDVNQSHKFPIAAMGSGPRPVCGPNVQFNTCNSYAPNNFQGNNQMFLNNPSACNLAPGMAPHMSGIEVPDENLTPQQRQHREKQLAIIRKMQQQLCPELIEHSNNMHSNNMIRMPASQQQQIDPCMMDPMMCPLSEHEHLPNSDPSLSSLMTPSSMISNNSASQFPHNQMPTSAVAQVEWQKLQHNYYEERRRKPPPGQLSNNMCSGPVPVPNNNMCSGAPTVPTNICSGASSVPTSHSSPLSQPSSALNSPSPIAASPGNRMPIPPPPYNQGMRPLSSPHPASPATGSLPLPSPRMQSPADASRQTLSSSGQRLPPHTSPGPATPSADSNSNSVPTIAHSPKSIPSSTQSSVQTSSTSSLTVSNNCSVPRTPTTMSCPNLPSNASTPSTAAPSPSNVKKLGIDPKTECSDMLGTNSSGNGNISNIVDANLKCQHSDVSMLGSGQCTSPFICKTEPSLMPVPSPQQIQYLSAFEGQELTIQKQPNTSLKDTDLISPHHISDLNLFPNDFNNCPVPHMNERIPNFMDSLNQRFPANPQMANMSGPQFDMNQRFMSEGNNQRFGGPGPAPGFDSNTRMQNMHEPQFRGQNMSCMPYNGPQLDNAVMRFNNCDGMIGPRMRGPNPMDMGMGTRFSSHMNDNMQSSPSQFGSPGMTQINNEQMMQFGGPNPPQGTNCMGPMNSFNSPGVMDAGVSSTHLQNLQKMTPPFDIGPPNKMEGMMVPNGGIPNQVMHGPNGPMAQRSAHFDQMASMGAMGEQTPPNQMNPQTNMMPGQAMNMSSMQVSTNGPAPGNMVNFHTSMSSMHGIHQNMGPEGNPNINGGMHGQYNMTQQMAHNMSGGPQTVNNTYVNATMSIQQLNIQNVTPPNYNSNMEQGMNNPNMNMPPSHGQGMGGSTGGLSPPPGMQMQMIPHGNMSKMGPGFGPSGVGHRGPGPGGGSFQGPPVNNTRGMNPMNCPSNAHMLTRGGPYNSANVQVKPDAPNTIQYLPARPQSSNQSNRPPSLDFLQRYAAPLTNLDNKLPTHNLQYFPNNGNNMNSPQGMPSPLQNRMALQNMPIASGPGRPVSGPMIRGPNPNPNMVSGPQSMMPSDMFNRASAPNNIGNGPPHNAPPGPNTMFPGMKPTGGGPMSPVGLSPDTSQPLPPSVGHSYNYKQTPFYGPMTSDPNYAVQFHNFQQQLYATNTRNSNNPSNANAGNARVNQGMPSAANFYGPSK